MSILCHRDLELVLATVATTLAATRPHVEHGIETVSSGSVGERHPAGSTTSTDDRLAAMADDIRTLREQVATLSQSRTKPPKGASAQPQDGVRHRKRAA